MSAIVRVETLQVADSGRRAAGAPYDSALASFILPAARELPVPRALADTDVTNYQAAGWWMRGNDTSARQRNRFALGYERFTSGVLVLRLDTLLRREQKETPFETSSGDSIVISGLGAAERIADECRLRGHNIDEHIVGLLPDSTPGIWMRPRIAWFVDTNATRFRSMRPDSLACWLPPDRDR